MALSIRYTDRFKSAYKKLEQSEKEAFQRKLRLFAENPTHPSLRVKKIQGADGLFEFSVNMDIRVIWYHEGDRIVALLDIGHHAVLNKY